MDAKNIISWIIMYMNNAAIWSAIMTRKRNVKPRFWLLLMGVLVAAFCCVYISQAGFMVRQTQQIIALEAQRDVAYAENAELERKISFSKTNEYVERTAREELGLLKPGEIRFVAGTGAYTQPDGQ